MLAADEEVRRLRSRRVARESSKAGESARPKTGAVPTASPTLNTEAPPADEASRQDLRRAAQEVLVEKGVTWSPHPLGRPDVERNLPPEADRSSRAGVSRPPPPPVAQQASLALAASGNLLQLSQKAQQLEETRKSTGESNAPTGPSLRAPKSLLRRPLRPRLPFRLIRLSARRPRLLPKVPLRSWLPRFRHGLLFLSSRRPRLRAPTFLLRRPL